MIVRHFSPQARQTRHAGRMELDLSDNSTLNAEFNLRQGGLVRRTSCECGQSRIFELLNFNTYGLIP